jgi:two-component system, OmpR family, sensor histidine kinase ChvG
MESPEAGAAAELAAPLRRAADAHRGEGFEIEVALPPGLPPVAVPAATLERVFAILLQNSRQAGARRATVGARAGRGHVAVSVADDGPGVPEADRERLFEPFFTSRRAEGGTGLGLPIARSLLAASQARIELARAEPSAKFELTLPRA